jgi:hypothetical protein
VAEQPTVQIPTTAFARLVKVAMHVSVGRSAAFRGQDPYPDATARRALGELAELGLIPVAVRQEPATEPEPESCAHCGKTIRRISGTLAEWWVHEPGGHTVCFPQQAASSPRATPKPAAGPQQSERPIVGYSGKGRVWCLACPRPDGEDVPVTVDVPQPYEECAGCRRDVVDVARTMQQDGEQSG